MSKVLHLLFLGILLGLVVLMLASVVSSCYFFITTFTLDDFEERTSSFILGIVNALFTYGIYHAVMHGFQTLIDKVNNIKNKSKENSGEEN